MTQRVSVAFPPSCGVCVTVSQLILLTCTVAKRVDTVTQTKALTHREETLASDCSQARKREYFLFLFLFNMVCAMSTHPMNAQTNGKHSCKCISHFGQFAASVFGAISRRRRRPSSTWKFEKCTRWTANWDARMKTQRTHTHTHVWICRRTPTRRRVCDIYFCLIISAAITETVNASAENCE